MKGNLSLTETERERDRDTDTDTERETERETDRDRDRERDREREGPRGEVKGNLSLRPVPQYNCDSRGDNYGFIRAVFSIVAGL